MALSQELKLPTTAPPGLGGPTTTASPTSLRVLDNKIAFGQLPSVPLLPLLSAHAPSFSPSPRRALRELLPSVDGFDAPAVASYAMVATTAPTHLASTSHGILDARAQVVQGGAEAVIAPSGDEATPPSSPIRPDPRTAPSPTSVAEALIQPQCFPAKQKVGKFKIELCRNFDKPGGCPFGNSCNYAHGELELRKKPLLTLHCEGNLDANWHRRYPCFDQVSGGAW